MFLEDWRGVRPWHAQEMSQSILILTLPYANNAIHS